MTTGEQETAKPSVPPRTEERIIELVHTALDEEVSDLNFDNDTPLYEEGIGLDSLGAATLSALLEEEFGTDPYTAVIEDDERDQFPQCLQDIYDFYGGKRTEE